MSTLFPFKKIKYIGIIYVDWLKEKRKRERKTDLCKFFQQLLHMAEDQAALADIVRVGVSVQEGHNENFLPWENNFSLEGMCYFSR